MTPAVAYLRVSGRSQIDGDGFDRQWECCTQYASGTADICIEHPYLEKAISGTTDETARPAFQQMVQDLLSNGCRTVIVEGLDRLAREYRIQESLLIYLAAKGITLIAARTGENITEAVHSDPMRKAMVQMQGVFAELEKALLVKKLRHARDSKRGKTGKCEGRKGYRELNPAIVAIITQQYHDGKGWPDIAIHLNALGESTITGKPFTASAVRAIWRRL